MKLEEKEAVKLDTSRTTNNAINLENLRSLLSLPRDKREMLSIMRRNFSINYWQMLKQAQTNLRIRWHEWQESSADYDTSRLIVAMKRISQTQTTQTKKTGESK